MESNKNQESLVVSAQVPRTLKELLSFIFWQIIAKRRWLLLPLWVLLALVGLLLIFTGNPHLIPAIYIGF